MTEPTLDDYLWAIAKAEMECPVVLELDADLGHSADCPCGATGRVPRFPELRTLQREHRACVVLDRFNPSTCDALPKHGDCHGLGYVPLWSKPEDLGTWIQVLGQDLAEKGNRDEYDVWCQPVLDGDILGAFKAATEALGIEVGQVTP
mgnify:FL=1